MLTKDLLKTLPLALLYALCPVAGQFPYMPDFFRYFTTPWIGIATILAGISLMNIKPGG